MLWLCGIAMDLCDEFGMEEDEADTQGEDVQFHQDIANLCSHTRFGQLVDDLSKSPKH